MNRSQIFGSISLLAIVVATGGFLWHQFGATHEGEDSSSEEQTPYAAAETVRLTSEKLAAARLEYDTVSMRSVLSQRTVPGKLRYDETQHVAVRAPTAGTLTEIRVQPGATVTAGDVLATLSSPQIGDARADVLQREAELAVAQRRNQWNRQVAKTLTELLERLRTEPDMEKVEAEFEGRPLGQYRQQLFAAYAQLVFSRRVAESVVPLAESGAVASRTIQERINARQQAEAAFDAACEQVAFEARLQGEQSAADEADARRRFKIAEQHLRTLLGYEESLESTQAMESLSMLEIRAPLGGTIESLSYSRNERLDVGDELCILADVSKLWVAADIRERDWQAVAGQHDTVLKVRLPAFPDRVLDAHIVYLGRQVDPVSQSVALMASLDNAYGDLRPGMFARATLPLGAPRETVAVAPEAVVQHEQDRFVFVVEAPQTFRRVNVEVGEEAEDWIEVTQGLAVGQRIVTHGAFLLKSELLLEGEEE